MLRFQKKVMDFCTMGQAACSGKGVDFKSVLFTGGNCHQSTKNKRLQPPKGRSSVLFLGPCRIFHVPVALVLRVTLLPVARGAALVNENPSHVLVFLEERAYLGRIPIRILPFFPLRLCDRHASPGMVGEAINQRSHCVL